MVPVAETAPRGANDFCLVLIDGDDVRRSSSRPADSALGLSITIEVSNRLAAERSRSFEVSMAPAMRSAAGSWSKSGTADLEDFGGEAAAPVRWQDP
jgi:hypothetical protein